MARTPGSDRGEAFRRWVRAQPPTTRGIIGAAVVIGWLAVWYVALLAIERAFEGDDTTWTDPLSSMIGPLIGIALVLWLRRRQMGSLARMWAFDSAVRRRRLPEDADPAEWAPMLEQARRFQRGAQQLSLGLTLLLLVATVLLSAWAGLGWPVGVAAVLIGAALIALVQFAGRRQSQRIDRLQHQLRSLPDRGPLTPGG